MEGGVGDCTVSLGPLSFFLFFLLLYESVVVLGGKTVCCIVRWFGWLCRQAGAPDDTILHEYEKVY